MSYPVAHRQRDKAETSSSGQDHIAPVVSSLFPAASLLLWGVSSSCLILINKYIMVDLGFKFPLMLTGLNQMISAMAGEH